MADVMLNPILEQLSGKVGDLVFRRYGDRTIIARKADRSGVALSEAQVEAQRRFRQAALYGRMVMADVEARALYDEAAHKKGQPLFSLMIADFVNAPEIDEVDVSAYGGAAGATIAVTAHDDFDVSGVEVTISDTDGNDVEQGAATPNGDGTWTYAATADVATGTTCCSFSTGTCGTGGR